MSFLQSLERVSFKKIVGFTFLAAVVLATPVTIWVSQQETKLAGRAQFEKPEVIKPVTKYGAPSVGNPRIALVWPFLGKPGDALLIEGENFGENPKEKQLKISNRIVTEENINQWTPELIEFIIPEDTSSGLISLQVAGQRSSWPYLFTVYNLETKIQVTEDNNVVQVIGAPAGSTVEIFFSDGEGMTSSQLEGVTVPSDKTILSVTVKNKAGNAIPFFVEPEEFNF